MKKKVFKKINFKILLISLVVVYSFAFIGSIFTSSNVDSQWYESIKVTIIPPNYVFPIVWNVLFFLIALSFYFSWISLDKKAKIKKNKNLRNSLILIFILNLVLNTLWSFVFFKLRNPFSAFFELLSLWFSIVLMISITWKINKISTYLLIPYLAWVSFAGVLNYLIAF